MTNTDLAFNEQLELLKTCVEENLDLSTELSHLGKTYDALRYKHSESHTNSLFDDEDYHTLLDFDNPSHGIPTVSFFSGAGGLDLGFEAAGFSHLASIEINEIFCETLKSNRKRWAVLGPPLHSGDIRNKDEFSHLLREKVGIKTPFEGVFHGGPPCQSFSIAANQRFTKEDENFKRVGFSHATNGNLLFDFIWYIIEFKPRAFLIENVPGLLTIDGGTQVAEAIKLLNKNGYGILEPSVLNAADYGVPQNRHRAFIIGSRTGQVIFPEQETGIVPVMAALKQSVDGNENHITRNHRADSILRYMELKYGQRDQLGRVDRLNPKLPSKTIIAGGNKGGGRSHLHPEIPRTLSVRESARLQTFPDDYIFAGSSARQYTQMGNAVPPLLAMKLANQIFTGAYKS
jgi:DNA (cytosine-5)-methyltransferase 1